MIKSLDAEDKNATNDEFWHLLLLGLGLLMTFQLIRVYVTSLVYAFGERYGQTLAAVPALVVFVSPFLLPILARLLSPQRLLFIFVGGLAALRLWMQFSRDINLNMVLAGLAIVMALMALALALPRLSPARFVQGIFLGMTLEVALHGAFLTWDYAWQSGWSPLLSALIVSAAALYALWKVRASFNAPSASEPPLRDALPLVALGPFFMLEMLFFQNAAFVASSGLVSMETALGVVLIGNAIGLGMPGLFARLGRSARLVAGLALVVLMAWLPRSAGPVVIALILVGQGLAAGLLASVLSGLSAGSRAPGQWRMPVVVGTGSLIFILLAILYYISTLITLPFSYTVLPPVGAGVIFLAAVAQPRYASTLKWQLIGLPLACLVIPFVIFLTRPAMPQETASQTSFRLLDYNIHQAITAGGWLDPEGIAQVIETQRPDVLVLQEVSRGWLIAGSLDVAEWLSRRLKMPYVYAPGHDYQFGNIIFSRWPIANWSFARLPLRNVPLGRGLILAELDLAAGGPVTIINTHLSAYATTESRIPQVQKVLEVWNHAPRTLIAGDMNAEPGDDDMALLMNAGFASAQDVAGRPDQLTYPSVNPVRRIDWIFGTPEVAFSEFAILPSTASDHLPLVVTVTVR